MGWLEDALKNYQLARLQLGGGEQGHSPQDDAAQLLVQGYQKYLKRSGRGQEPLLEGLTRKLGNGQTQMSETGGAGLVPGADGQSFRVTSHGPREGMVHQRYGLGGGQFANVYYDPRTGRRQVVKFRAGGSATGPGKGVVR